MIIAIDFDGTCVDHRYPDVGRSIPGAISTLRELVKLRHSLVLFTMRSGRQLDDAVKWFRDNEIELYGVQAVPDQHTWTSSPKCGADLFIDDLALGAPLREYGFSSKPCIDWDRVREYFNLEKE